MKIQPISNACRNRQNLNNQTPTFNGYREAMHDAIYFKFDKIGEISDMTDCLYKELANENGVKKHRLFGVINNKILSTSAINLVKQLCKPIAKVTPNLRDVIFESDEEMLKILQSKNSPENVLAVVNDGKQGFFNTLFKNQNAKNDIKLLFASSEGYIELGMKKDNSITLEQGHHGYWNKSSFNSRTGEKISTKSGDMNENPAYPLF